MEGREEWEKTDKGTQIHTKQKRNGKRLRLLHQNSEIERERVLFLISHFFYPPFHRGF